MMGRAGTDEMYVDQGFWDATGKEISNYTYSAFSRIPNTVWEMQYIGISRCNVVIGEIKSTEVSMPADTKKRILGEASFLRAFYYFQLARYFGGVPIITEETNLNEFKNIRSSLAETYQRVIDDFKVAVDNLPGSNEAGRATMFSAKSCLAKAYLQMSGEPLKDVTAASQAAKYAKEVIDTGIYDLEPNYKDIFPLQKSMVWNISSVQNIWLQTMKEVKLQPGMDLRETTQTQLLIQYVGLCLSCMNLINKAT